MRTVRLSLRSFVGDYLVEELASAGIVAEVRVVGDHILIRVPDGTSDATISAVVESHDPAPRLATVAAARQAFEEHLPHLRDYSEADPATITGAQTVHVVKDIIRTLRYLNRRLD